MIEHLQPNKYSEVCKEVVLLGKVAQKLAIWRAKKRLAKENITYSQAVQNLGQTVLPIVRQQGSVEATRDNLGRIDQYIQVLDLSTGKVINTPLQFVPYSIGKLKSQIEAQKNNLQICKELGNSNLTKAAEVREKILEALLRKGLRMRDFR